MKIVILPVSGNRFGVQLAINSELCDIGYRPDITLTGSGGTVTSYITLAGGYVSTGIERVSELISSTILFTPWYRFLGTGLNFLSWIIGYFKGSLYGPSTKVIPLFKELFNKETIEKAEIWTAVTNMKHKKAQIYCNKSKETSVIKGEIDCNLYNCMPLTYLNGDIEKIATIALASASIPSMIPGQVFNNDIIVDTGVLYASPLVAMQDILHDLGPNLHITYINSFDIEKERHMSYKVPETIFHSELETVSEMVRSLCVQDRLAAINLLKRCLPLSSKDSFGNLAEVGTFSKDSKDSKDLKDTKYLSQTERKIYFSRGSGNKKVLAFIEKHRTKCIRSVLECYPCDENIVNLHLFCGKDVIKCIEENRKSYCFRLWWIGKRDIFSGIKRCHRETMTCGNVSQTSANSQASTMDSISNSPRILGRNSKCS